MNIAIIYVSKHHSNTQKIVETMQKARKLDIYTVDEAKNVDLKKYDAIGFASGIYFHNFDETIINLIESKEFRENQKVFTIYSCGINYINYAKKVEKLLKSKNCQIIGNFSCRGKDTYGIFGKIGGIANSHPNEKDLKKAEEFIKGV